MEEYALLLIDDVQKIIRIWYEIDNDVCEDVIYGWQFEDFYKSLLNGNMYYEFEERYEYVYENVDLSDFIEQDNVKLLSDNKIQETLKNYLSMVK